SPNSPPLLTPPPPTSTLFPYTTLFRSIVHEPVHRANVHDLAVQCNAHDPAIHIAHGPASRVELQTPPSRCNRLQAGSCALHWTRSEEHTSELQSRFDLVCRLLLEKKKN